MISKPDSRDAMRRASSPHNTFRNDRSRTLNDARRVASRLFFLALDFSLTIAHMTRVSLLLLIGTLMTLPSCKSAQHPDSNYPGASTAFTTDDPIVKQAQELMNEG